MTRLHPGFGQVEPQENAAAEPWWWPRPGRESCPLCSPLRASCCFFRKAMWRCQFLRKLC